MPFVSDHPTPPDAKRILIIRPSALGDVCRSVPVLCSLRQAYPDARIDWLVRDVFVPAIAEHPHLSGFVAFPRSGFSRWWKPSVAGRIRRFLRGLKATRYDLVIDAQGLSRSGFFAWATRARNRVGFADAREIGWLGLNHRVRMKPGLHAVDRMLELVRAIGIEPVHDLRLYAAAADVEWWANRRRHLGIAGDYDVFAPTAKWASKSWPAESWRDLAGRVLGDDGPGEEPSRSIVYVGAPGEEARVEGAIPTNSDGSSRSGVTSMAGGTTVGQMMAIIADASRVVACDSAALHMAIGFDRPSVGLFGPTDPALVGPYGDRAIVLRGGSDADLASVHYRDRGLDDRLMRGIDVDAVEAAVNRLEGAP